MKNVMFGTVVALGLSTAAHADNFDVIGETEYAFEAEVFTLEAGAEYNLNQFRFTGVAQFDNDNTMDDFEFTSVEVEAGYFITENLEMYVRVETNDQLDYDEAVVGAAFRF